MVRPNPISSRSSIVGLKYQKDFALKSKWYKYYSLLTEYEESYPDVVTNFPYTDYTKLAKPIINFNVTNILDAGMYADLEGIKGNKYNNTVKTGFLGLHSKSGRNDSDYLEEDVIIKYLTDLNDDGSIRKLEEYLVQPKFRCMEFDFCITGVLDMIHVPSNTPIEIKNPIYSRNFTPTLRDDLQVQLYMYITESRKGLLLKHFRGDYCYKDINSIHRSEKIITMLEMIVLTNDMESLLL